MEEEVPRFALFEGKIDDFIHEQENENTRAKTDRDVSLIKTFLQRKVELRNVEEIPPAQLNELLSEFVLTVRIKGVNYCEPTSLRGMIDSVERYLKRKNYQASIIKDLVFGKTGIML